MQDRFKFRAWNKKQKIMHYNAENTYDYLVGKPIIPAAFFGSLLEKEEFIIEQCTGLKDKNGKLIYEGDVLQDCEQKIKVVFDEERHCFMFEYQNTRAYKPICDIDVLSGNFEVIGNIHENADLLEKE